MEPHKKNLIVRVNPEITNADPKYSIKRVTFTGTPYPTPVEAFYAINAGGATVSKKLFESYIYGDGHYMVDDGEIIKHFYAIPELDAARKNPKATLNERAILGSAKCDEYIPPSIRANTLLDRDFSREPDKLWNLMDYLHNPTLRDDTDNLREKNFNDLDNYLTNMQRIAKELSGEHQRYFYKHACEYIMLRWPTFYYGLVNQYLNFVFEDASEFTASQETINFIKLLSNSKLGIDQASNVVDATLNAADQNARVLKLVNTTRAMFSENKS